VHQFGFGLMQSLFIGRSLLVEELDFPRWPLEIRMPLHVESRKSGEYAGSSFRIAVFVTNLDQIRLLESIDIQTARQLASGVFDFGWAIEVRSVGGNKSRKSHHLLQQIFVAQELDFGIKFFLGDIGAGEIHGAGGLGRDDGVIASPAE